MYQARDIAYNRFARKNGALTEIEVPAIAWNEDFVSIANNVQVGEFIDSKFKPDQEKTERARQELFQKSPKIICIRKKLWVKEKESSFLEYALLEESAFIKPADEQRDYVLGVNAASIYLGWTEKRLRENIREGAVDSFKYDNKKGSKAKKAWKQKPHNPNKQVFLLSELNRIIEKRVQPS